MEDLRVSFATRRGTVYAVNGITFDVAPGETLGIVGESGCGKSVMSLAILGLIAANGRIESGRALFGSVDLLRQSDRALPHPAGELVRVVLEPGVRARDSHAVEELRGTRRRRFAAHVEVRLERLPDLTADG